MHSSSISVKVSSFVGKASTGIAIEAFCEYVVDRFELCSI